ncbi:hypothetical protein GJW-30_1_00460 [Variibacter gotjawalensis]|uniref:PemK-like protein n=1 Tax=Variibacter gotjawalensis TaxID=1333996 RepID=A0A0S3PPY2_9BRAD|nr:hypothetical protein [Variibacter gotjawalensis]NIK48247.1 hypothetical protein [Variibacter gotjawalensis]RZS50119.1 hypothetical protein EV661_2570 [Variibacter gotjawalensis]BAT57949.1 hypothetical protein GJW-30_1_00460 [Variibacter gotjawalensis]
MTYADLQTGVVIVYPFLWAREQQRGETEGRKPRPTAVGVRLRRNDGDTILLFPITSRAPDRDRFAAEIPETEKRRAGLDIGMRLWIILDEYNTDNVGHSFYLEPTPPLGRFSKAFFLPLMKQFIARAGETRGVSRRG